MVSGNRDTNWFFSRLQDADDAPGDLTAEEANRMSVAAFRANARNSESNETLNSHVRFDTQQVTTIASIDCETSVWLKTTVEGEGLNAETKVIRGRVVTASSEQNWVIDPEHGERISAVVTQSALVQGRGLTYGDEIEATFHVVVRNKPDGTSRAEHTLLGVRRWNASDQ